jgi:hypothetical protein
MGREGEMNLLDLFRVRELKTDPGAFDGRRSLDQQSGAPFAFRRVIRGRIARSEIHHGYPLFLFFALSRHLQAQFAISAKEQPANQLRQIELPPGSRCTHNPGSSTPGDTAIIRTNEEFQLP